MSENWPPSSFQTSKPLGNMTALESQEPATEEVGIVNPEYMCMLVCRRPSRKKVQNREQLARNNCERGRPGVGKRTFSEGGVVTAYRYNLTGIEWIISTSP